MAELTQSEKLQPCLLDRLTDNEPHKQQEHRNQRVMSMQRFRHAVLRDLAWLLNTYANAEQNEYDEYEEIPSSVLNFGVQSASGRAVSSLNADDLRYELIQALQRFEPRIIANSISIVMAIDPGEMSNRSIRFEIRGDLWSQPIPESLYIRTDLDIETGKCNLDRG